MKKIPLRFLASRVKTNNFDDGTGEVDCRARGQKPESEAYVRILRITKQTMTSTFCGGCETMLESKKSSAVIVLKKKKKK